MAIPRHGETHFVDDYRLPDHWCFHIYSYRAVLELDGEPHPIHPGCASIISPCTRMVYRYEGASEHVYFHFQADDVEPKVEFEQVFDLGDHYAEMDRRARQAIERKTIDSALATATLWSLLCEIAVLQRPGQGNQNLVGHPKIAVAVRHIEQNLSRHLTVAQLCREVGVSDGYLSRLFSEHLGQSVLSYIRSRRAEQAEHLLRATTLPIKTIARYVGVPDLQQFNRLIHQLKGASPREIRFGGQKP